MDTRSLFSSASKKLEVSSKLKLLDEIGLLQRLKEFRNTRTQVVTETLEEDEEDDDELPEFPEEDDDEGGELNYGTASDEEAYTHNRDDSCDHGYEESRSDEVSVKERAPSNVSSAATDPTPDTVPSRNRSTQSTHSLNDTRNNSTFTKFTVKGKTYYLLSLIGKGGSAKVYHVFEASTQTNYAVKVVELAKADEATKKGYMNEIAILQKLSACKRVVRLIDYEGIKGPTGELTKLLLVMEKGDADLAGVLKQFIETDSKYSLDPHLIKHYWKEMLKAVDEIHSLDVVHSDLKPVNFITVAGKLKLIDFGIANAIQSDHTSVIKDTQIGTINYMAPEALQNRADSSSCKSGKLIIKFNCKADIWSLGCILYNLVYGKPPFGDLPSLICKVQAIINPRHEINFPPLDDTDLVDCIKKCLERDPMKRPTTKELLEHPYLNQAPSFRQFSTPRAPFSSAMKAPPTQVKNMVSQINDLTPGRRQKLSKFLEDLSLNKLGK